MVLNPQEIEHMVTVASPRQKIEAAWRVALRCHARALERLAAEYVRAGMGEEAGLLRVAASNLRKRAI